MSFGFDYDKPSSNSDCIAHCAYRAGITRVFDARRMCCVPDDASVVEHLESETGVTITRLGHPIELYRETFLKDPAGRFAFLGPFETNQMGQRELFLWIAVPIEPVADSVPEVEINGTAVSLGTPGRTADFAGINKSPYKIPLPGAQCTTSRSTQISWRDSARPQTDGSHARGRQERRGKDRVRNRSHGGRAPQGLRFPIMGTFLISLSHSYPNRELAHDRNVTRK